MKNRNEVIHMVEPLPEERVKPDKKEENTELYKLAKYFSSEDRTEVDNEDENVTELTDEQYGMYLIYGPSALEDDVE